MWSWWNCLEQLVPEGKEVLRLNLDETAVKFYYQGRKGLVCPDRKGKKRFRSPRQKTSKGQLKKAVTHVAIICDNTSIQPRLPQIILGSEFTFQARKMKELRAQVNGNVQLWRLKSAWVNKKVFVDIVERLGEILQPLLSVYQPVLFMDAHRVHCATEVLRSLAKYHIWPIIVPASTTWLLQPLDTHAFARYKQALRTKYTTLLSKSQGRELDVGAVVSSVNDCCRQILQGTRWENAFVSNGFGNQQHHVRPHVLEALEITTVVVENRVLPTLAQLCSCFPTSADFSVEYLFKDLVPPPPGPVRVPLDVVARVEPEETESWAVRLRPRRSLSRVASAEVLVETHETPPPVAPSSPAVPLCLPAARTSSPPPLTTFMPPVLRARRLPREPRMNP